MLIIEICVKNIEILLSEDCWIFEGRAWEKKEFNKEKADFKIGNREYVIRGIDVKVANTEIGEGLTTGTNNRGIREAAIHTFYDIQEKLRRNPKTYKIISWEGSCPLPKHIKNKTGRLTRKASEKIVNVFRQALIAQKEFVENFEESYKSQAYAKLLKIMKSKGGSEHFYWRIKDKELIDIYCGIREISEKEARSLVLGNKELYFELETEFLHRKEGKGQIKKKINSEKGKIYMDGVRIY